MPRINRRVAGQRINLLPYRALQHVEIAARQIGAAHAPREQCIAHKCSLLRREIKQHAPRTMPRHIAHLHASPQRVDDVTLFDPGIHLDRLYAQIFAQEAVHDLGRLDQYLAVRMRQHLGSRSPYDLRAALRVIPVSVSNPQLHEAAAVFPQQRLDLRPHVGRSIDEHRFAPRRRGQQVSIGLNRPGGHDMNVHRFLKSTGKPRPRNGENSLPSAPRARYV